MTRNVSEHTERRASTPAPAATAQPLSSARPASKKDQIRVLFEAGIHDLEELAALTDARPSYVATVLQRAGLLHGYFDLYTSTAHAMNVYSKAFVGRLAFKNKPAARRSVAYIDQLYRTYEKAGDRAGQHHALMMAMMMFNRARWTGKTEEADVFRNWLLKHLSPKSAAEPAVVALPLPVRSQAA